MDLCFDNRRDNYLVKEYNGLRRRNTLIMIAMRFGLIHPLRVILDHYRTRAIFDITTTNIDGDTALTIGVKHCDTQEHLECIKYILNRFFDISRQNCYNHSTPLMIASKYCNSPIRLECVRLLLQNNASINSQCDKGLTAIMYAIKYCVNPEEAYECVRMLLNNNANINISSNNGLTSLMYAIKYHGNSKIIKLVLKHGKRMYNQNIQNALDYADKYQDSDECVNLLKSYKVHDTSQ